MLASKYPSPVHETIIEPFAGSAAYSLHSDHWERNVILGEINTMVFNIWKYLQSSSQKDILSLPDPEIGTDIRSRYSQLLPEELDLIGLHIGIGKPTFRSKVGKFSRWAPGKRYIANNIHKIKNWKINHCHYSDLSVVGDATWFIDPPYQYAGIVYKNYKSINYDHLKDWTLKRKGFLIVCGDYNRDTWLPFEVLGNTKSAGKKKSIEGVFIR